MHFFLSIPFIVCYLQGFLLLSTMVRTDRCCVGPCNNEKQNQNKLIKMNHATELKWHRFPMNNEEKRSTDSTDERFN